MELWCKKIKFQSVSSMLECIKSFSLAFNHRTIFPNSKSLVTRNGKKLRLKSFQFCVNFPKNLSFLPPLNFQDVAFQKTINIICRHQEKRDLFTIYHDFATSSFSSTATPRWELFDHPLPRSLWASLFFLRKMVIYCLVALLFKAVQ